MQRSFPSRHIRERCHAERIPHWGAYEIQECLQVQGTFGLAVNRNCSHIFNSQNREKQIVCEHVKRMSECCGTNKCLQSAWRF